MLRLLMLVSSWLLVLHVEAVDVGLQLVVVLDEELFSLARGLLLQDLLCPAPLHPLPLLCSLVRCLGSGSGFGLYMGFGLSKRVCFVLLRCGHWVHCLVSCLVLFS